MSASHLERLKGEQYALDHIRSFGNPVASGFHSARWRKPDPFAARRSPGGPGLQPCDWPSIRSLRDVVRRILEDSVCHKNTDRLPSAFIFGGSRGQFCDGGLRECVLPPQWAMSLRLKKAAVSATRDYLLVTIE